MSDTMLRGRHGSTRRTTRATGREWRAAMWTLRHPAFVLLPALAAVAVWRWGPVAAGVALGGLVVGLVVWARLHPPSFDRWIAPRLRAGWRRWTTYRGRRWAGVLADCELTREQRRTGELLVPRVLRVRSATPSIDTVYVRMVRGQDLKTWTDRAEALAVAGRHVLTAGASGAGKSSLLWAPLRAMGPMIRDGLVRVSMVDLKGGAETERGRDLFSRYATTAVHALDLLTEVRDAMKDRQEQMRATGVRRLTVTAETPLELVMVDEMAMLTAYGDRADVREALRLLAEILTQGRACLVSVMGYVQEPSKDVIDVRELFTTRVCLGVTAASHVDMMLGDGARERGALADEIPGDLRHAGIGYVIDATSRLPVRFRAAHVTDDEIDELVDRCRPWAKPGDVIDASDDDEDVA